MQDRHVDVKGSKLRFCFRGKSGRPHEVDVTDCRVAKIVLKLQDLPGQDLFQYVDDEGDPHNITSQDVNEYLREITSEDFTAKDFRTWAGTVLAAIALSAAGEFETKRQAKANIKNAIEAVAKILGNTRAFLPATLYSSDRCRDLFERGFNRRFEAKKEQLREKEYSRKQRFSSFCKPDCNRAKPETKAEIGKLARRRVQRSGSACLSRAGDRVSRDHELFFLLCGPET